MKAGREIFEPFLLYPKPGRPSHPHSVFLIPVNPIRYIQSRFKLLEAKRQIRDALAEIPKPPLGEADFAASIEDPDAFYRRAFQDFHRQLPQELRDHRAYFQVERRGFGEDAFHTMWSLLFHTFPPSSFLEIGVYRGQVLSLVALLAKLAGKNCPVTGISPFSSVGDSVSVYRGGLDYREDTLKNFRHFGLPEPNLVEAYSTDPKAVAEIEASSWDMIYIDGNHDYEIVVKDWEVCSRCVAPGGIIVLDDSGLTTSYHPPAFATAGHPGPSRLASEIKDGGFAEILQVGHNRVFRRQA